MCKFQAQNSDILNCLITVPIQPQILLHHLRLLGSGHFLLPLRVSVALPVPQGQTAAFKGTPQTLTGFGSPQIPQANTCKLHLRAANDRFLQVDPRGLCGLHRLHLTVQALGQRTFVPADSRARAPFLLGLLVVVLYLPAELRQPSGGGKLGEVFLLWTQLRVCSVWGTPGIFRRTGRFF